MIVRRGLDLVRLARELGPLLLLLLAYDVVVTALYTVFGQGWLAIDDLPLPLLGSAIVLVLTLRNNAAYARWWEARGLWGAVVNNSRSLARGLLTVVEDRALRHALVRLQIGYVTALRCHLLRLPPWDALAEHVPAEKLARLHGRANVPFALQGEMAALLSRSTVDTVGRSALDRTLSALADAQGGMERIKNTPLPRQYSQFPRVFSRIYCVALPVGLVHDLGVLTPLASTVVGFMFLALDQIGRDLEDPFEGTIHDVPMQAVARTVEIDLLELIGAADIPEPEPIADGVLA